MNRVAVAQELVKLAKSLVAGLGDFDIKGVSFEKVEQKIKSRYGEDSKQMIEALRELVAKFKRRGNSSIKKDGNEFVLVMTKDKKELHFQLYKGGESTMSYQIASFIPPQDMVDAYERIYKGSTTAGR